MRLCFAPLLAAIAVALHAQSTPPTWLLPTENHALLDGQPVDFFQFIDRSTKEGQIQVWEGGQFGFVRNPTKLTTGEEVFTRFHEGLDIKPVHRDAKDEPLDEVHAIAPGEVVHCSTSPGASNYGRYVVVKHDWGQGPFCSLYAHLKEVRCEVGQKVEPGALLGIMGYSGVGIDRRRAHTHLELTLILSSRFSVWHDHITPTLNRHGNWNGLNLIGLDIGRLYLDQKKNGSVSPVDLVKNAPPHFRVAVPGTAEMELLTNYPWLCATPRGETPPKRWEITFTTWGLPVKIEPGDQDIDEPKVTWVQPSLIPHYSRTRGLLNGKGDKATLTSEGASFVQLATGTFRARPKVAEPVATTPTKKSSSKSKKK